MPSLRADNPANQGQMDALISNQMDVTGAEHVEVRIDRINKVIHINVNGICLLRICRIKGWDETLL